MLTHPYGVPLDINFAANRARCISKYTPCPELQCSHTHSAHRSASTLRPIASFFPLNIHSLPRVAIDLQNTLHARSCNAHTPIRRTDRHQLCGQLRPFFPLNIHSLPGVAIDLHTHYVYRSAEILHTGQTWHQFSWSCSSGDGCYQFAATCPYFETGQTWHQISWSCSSGDGCYQSSPPRE